MHKAGKSPTEIGLLVQAHRSTIYSIINPKPYTKKEKPVDPRPAEVVRLWHEGLLASEIALMTGMHRNSVTRTLRQQGLKRELVVEDDRWAEAERLWRAGKLSGEIAATMRDTTRNAVIGHMKRRMISWGNAPKPVTRETVARKQRESHKDWTSASAVRPITLPRVRWLEAA